MACVHTLQENSQTLNPSANVWFGLFKDAWLWSDGAETSFRYWQTGQSYSGNCVSAESAQQGRWIQADCNQKTNFVCHGGAVMFWNAKLNTNVFFNQATQLGLKIMKAIIMTEIIILCLHSAGLKLRKRVIRIKVQSAVDLTDPTAYSSLLTMVQTRIQGSSFLYCPTWGNWLCSRS